MSPEFLLHVQKSSSWKRSNTVVGEPNSWQSRVHATAWFIYNSCMSVFYFVQIQQEVTSTSLLGDSDVVDILMLMTLSWWQFWVVGDRISMLVTSSECCCSTLT